MKRKTKIFTLFMTVLLALSLFSPAASAASFSDIPSNAWYLANVQSLVSKNIIQGKGNGKFAPNASITRAEIVTMLAKTVLSQGEIQQYAGKSKFNDVAAGMWFTPYINWAAEAGVVAGYDGNVFRPNAAIKRQEMARMIINFANAYGFKLSARNAAVSFKDQSNIEAWARESVAACQTAGIINGDPGGTFRPRDSSTRGEAAAMYDRFLNYKSGSDYTVTFKKVNGVSVKAVEFSLGRYPASITTAYDRIYGGESMANMVSRTGAKFAVNAAYFDMNTYAPTSTMINGGSIVTVDNNNPNAATFVMDTSRRGSIQNMNVNQKAILTRGGSAISSLANVGKHKKPSGSADATRIIFTSTWGSSVGFPVSDAIIVDSNGTITRVIKPSDNASDVGIPSSGYVLCQRARRPYEGNFFDSCRVGDRIALSFTYPGSAVSNIQTAIAAGPTIVRNGQAYNNYYYEGITKSDIVSGTNQKISIGLKSNGNVVLLTAYCNIGQLSNVMVSMGCQSALNLDGGSSAGIYYDGQWLIRPGRALNNMIYFR